MASNAAQSTRASTAPPAIDADESLRAALDAFITRNQDTSIASVERSRIELGKAVQSARTIADIIADGSKRHSSAGWDQS
jgi:hypothetical protein